MLLSGTNATVNFHLNDYMTEAELVAAVRNIPYGDGLTNTTGALRLMRSEIFNLANGDRADVENVAILITDGEPTIELGGLQEEVSRVKNSGTRVIGIGVTSLVSEMFLIIFIYRKISVANINIKKTTET